MTKDPVELEILRLNILKAREAITGFNRWVAGVNLGHDPTNTECLRWYVDHGGPQNFAQRYSPADQQVLVA